MLARNAAFLDPAVIVIIIKKGDDDVNIRSIVIIPCPNDLISIRRTVQVIIILSVHPSGFHQKKGQQEEYMSAEMQRSEEHTSELQSLMRISYAVFYLKQKKTKLNT